MGTLVAYTTSPPFRRLLALAAPFTRGGGGSDLIRRGFQLFGSEVYHTNSLILLVKNMLCSKLHCQKGYNLNTFSNKIEGFGQWNPFGAGRSAACRARRINLRTTTSPKYEAVPRRALVYKAHRRVYHSTLGLSVIKKKKNDDENYYTIGACY